MVRRLLLTLVLAGTLARAQSSSPPPSTPATPAAPTPSGQTPAPATDQAKPQTPDPNDPSSAPDWKGDKPQKSGIGQRMKDAVTSVPCIRIGGGGCLNETPQTRIPKSSKTDSGSGDQPQDPQEKRPGSPGPNQQMPRSDQQRSLNADGESSSRSTIGDLSPPRNDAANHPNSSVEDDVAEVRPWDPHRSLKDVEVGDFYFTRQNYRAAESRYQEALLFKDNNAEAMYKLALVEEKLDQPAAARKYYALYLKTLPHGEHADEVQKALERLGSEPSAEKR